jgi:hypothetical protein
MLVHGVAPASNLHLGYTLPSVRSCLRGVVRLNSWPAANQKHQTVMIVTGVASDWEYLRPMTNRSLKRQSAFSGGSHD